jgi:hypothetical protein
MLVKTLHRTVLNRRLAPVPAPPGPIRISAATTEKLPRRFGEFLITSHLDEDALGAVYRALVLGEEHVFVQLRLLNSPELPWTSLAETLAASSWYVGTLSGAAVARGVRMGSFDGIPFIASTEPHGWPLHGILRALRAAGRRLAIEHSILIADRIAAGLEAGQKTRLERRPVLHGLVWPGFVSIGEHGDVRLGGFGVASAILPVLYKKRLTEEVAPYLAPEERQEKRVAVNSDVYAVGAVLLELLTGRQPRPDSLRPDFRVEDGFPESLARVLRVCFAPIDLRFPSLTSLRRELGKVVVETGLEPSSYRLAHDLKTLFPPSGPPGADDSRAPVGAPKSPTDAEIESTLEDLWKRMKV